MQPTTETENCCDTFRRAVEEDTDNEGYEALAHYSDDGSVVMGSNLPPIKFCPWCGAPYGLTAPETPLERAFTKQPETGVIDAALRRIGYDR